MIMTNAQRISLNSGIITGMQVAQHIVCIQNMLVSFVVAQIGRGLFG